MLLVICASIFVFLLLFNFYPQPDYCKHIPTISGLQFVRATFRLINPLNTFDVMHECFKKYGPNFIFQIGPMDWVIIGEVKLLERILSSTINIRKSEDYKLFSGWLGDGLVSSAGNHWKTHRKAITPSFHFKMLEEFISVFNKESRVLVSQLKKEVGKDTFDVHKYTTLFALDVICETAMGTSQNFQGNPNHPYHQRIEEILGVLYRRSINPAYKMNWIYRFSNLYKTEKAALKEINAFCKDIVESRKRKLEKTLLEKDDFNRKRKVCFLDTLLQNPTLTAIDLQDEINTFMFAGHDTTAICISLVLYCLSHNSVIQERVYDEVISLIGTDDDILPNISELNEMKYLEMVIKETLRIYPSVPQFARNLTEDVKYNNIIIPAGTCVVIFPYLIHRNPSIYPEPEKFIPERFTIEESAKRHPYGYLAFSAGPRNCIGQKFALLEIKAVISKVLRHYKILPAVPECPPKLTSCITTDSVNGVHIRIQERR